MGRRIAIVGAGQSGLQLGLGLLGVGHLVTLVSNRTSQQVRAGPVQSSQVFEGEPLVFHSGSYRVATRHPELETT